MKAIIKNATIALVVMMNITSLALSENLHHMQLETHLGDGVHVNHFSFIKETMKKSRESRDEVLTILETQKHCEKRPIELKPPSAKIKESEVSHLLDIIRKQKQQQSVAIFNRNGLKIAAAGSDLESIAISDELFTKLQKLPNDRPLVRDLSCEEAKAFKLSCNDDLKVIYWSVWDDMNPKKLIGFSRIVTKVLPI